MPGMPAHLLHLGAPHLLESPPAWMEVYIGQLDALKENGLQVASAMAPWQWALVALTGYKMWRYYQDYIPIPTYGGILSFSRLLSAIRLSRQGPEGFSQFYFKYPMVLFPRVESWTVLVQPQFFDEIIKAPEEVLSFMDGTSDVLQIEYTFGKRMTETRDFHGTIQNRLTRHLTQLFPEVFEEVQLTLSETLPTRGDAWKKVHVFPWVLQTVARASNRIFVGIPLCRDKAWLDFNLNGPAEVMAISGLLNILPKWTWPILGPLIGSGERRVRKAIKWTGPLIEERLNMDPSQRPDDFVTWLLINAPESDRTVPEITRRLLTVNFAAIHTTSLNLTHALYWLIARPQYVAPLREEIEETIGRLGWTKGAIGQMPKLESFMKECIRIDPLGVLAVTRKARKSFTFSNGITVPPGTFISAHLHGVHRDGTIYERPDEFDGFRFVDEKSKGDENARKAVPKARQTMYTTSKTYLGFGHGRHACPGRFFAVMELKMIMAYMLVNYDMKWPDEELPSNLSATEQGYRPPDFWFNFIALPNQTAHMMIQRRV